jgi:hypothetical protein
MVYISWIFLCQYFAQHCAQAPCFRNLWKLTVVCGADCHCHSHGHREDVYATRKPGAHALLQAIVMSLKEIPVAKYITVCYHVATHPHEQSVATSEQLIMTTMPNITELALK